MVDILDYRQGEPGIEPPADIKRLYDFFSEGLLAPPEKGNQNAQEIYKALAENVWEIGTVGLGARIAVVNQTMGNVPEFAVMDWPFRGPSTAYPEQFHYK